MTEVSEIKLYISIPSNRPWVGKFGTAAMGLTAYLTANGVKCHKFTGSFVRAWGQVSCLSEARQMFVDEMIDGNYTHWLSLDDDMPFPADIVDRLAAHDKDVVAINGRHKTDEEIKGSLLDFNGKPIDSTGKTGLERIYSMGGAIFLAKIAAFKHIPKPHFEVRWMPGNSKYLHEDRYFAQLLHEAGVEMYCDHDASKTVFHTGEKDYGWPEIEARAAEKPKMEKIGIFLDGLTLLDKAAA